MVSGLLTSLGQKLASRPVLALGFRPFYLVAIIYAVCSLPLWSAIYFGWLSLDGYLQGSNWHSHEMVFGFVVAVIAGFLLTSVRAWTGQPTATGAPLAGLALIWLVARVLALTGPATLAAVIDIAFLPSLAISIAIPILHSRNRRNYKILLLLVGLTGVNIIYQLSSLRILPLQYSYYTINTALDFLAVLLATIGGRVIPAFTSNAIGSAKPRQVYSIEMLALGSLILILVVGIVEYWTPVWTPIWLVLLATATVSHGMRLLLWQPYLCMRNPLLAMLPIAYLWIPLTYALRFSAQLTPLPSATAAHALVLGAITSMMVAMMMRSSLGHSGRKLVAGTAEICIFTFVQLAAISRVLASFLPTGFYSVMIFVSAASWTLGFTLFLFAYWGILTRPRIDGKPG